MRYSCKEAAKRLGLTYQRFMVLKAKNGYQCHQISPRKVYFTDEDLEAIEKSFETRYVPNKYASKSAAK